VCPRRLSSFELHAAVITAAITSVVTAMFAAATAKNVSPLWTLNWMLPSQAMALERASSSTRVSKMELSSSELAAVITAAIASVLATFVMRRGMPRGGVIDSSAAGKGRACACVAVAAAGAVDIPASLRFAAVVCHHADLGTPGRSSKRERCRAAARRRSDKACHELAAKAGAAARQSCSGGERARCVRARPTSTSD